MREEILHKMKAYVDNIDFIVSKFSSKEYKQVSFHEIVLPMHGKGMIEISKGCFAELTSEGPDRFRIKCIMDPSTLPEGETNVILGMHDHPDYFEDFKVIEGHMYDDYSGREIKKGGSYEFKPNEPHTPRVNVYTVIDIVGTTAKSRLNI